MTKSLLIVILLVIFLACTRKPPVERSINHAKLRDSLDSDTTREFTPFVGAERHLTIQYRIKAGQIVATIDTSDVRVAYGKMPKMPQSGTFQVNLLNKSDSLISHYYIANPFFVRVEGGGTSSQQRINEGSFYIRLPKGKSITKVVFLEVGQSLVESRIDDKISHIP